MAEQKKSFWQTLINAFTNRDELAAAQKAAEAKAAADKAALEQATEAKIAAAKMAANQMAMKQAEDAREQALKEIVARQNAARQALEEANRPKVGKVIVRSLRVRKDHSTKSPVVDGINFGDKISIINIWVDKNDMWAQLGPDRWSAIKYNGEELIELEEPNQGPQAV